MSKSDILNGLLEKEKLNKTKICEVRERIMAHGDISMRYSLDIIGEKPEGGYPLYIALHGGGESDMPDLNDSQWEIMKSYYKGGIESGIYAAPRGIRDTWDTHFNPESYYFYKRLIQNMIIFCGANPNRVYLIGYSAGGDGVYQITARMADFFAAANMSAGHPNGVRLTNLKNMPLYIQCGERDAAYRRNEETARYAKDENVAGAFLHKDKYHQICDNGEDRQLLAGGVLRDTNAVRLVSRHVRNPYPKSIEWDLSLKADDMFYYLESDGREGTVRAEYESNTFRIEGDVKTLYLSEEFIDFERDAVIFHGGRKITVKPEFDENVLRETYKRRFDASLSFTYKIDLKENRL